MEVLLKYILRPPLANERLLPGPDGLVRIALKKPFSDGTVAIDLDPLSLLCRLVALVPAPRFHTVRYFGVLAAASKWRPLIVPKPRPSQAADERCRALRFFAVQRGASERGRLALPPLGGATREDLRGRRRDLSPLRRAHAPARRHHPTSRA
jgi:hypothetical protein